MKYKKYTTQNIKNNKQEFYLHIHVRYSLSSCPLIKCFLFQEIFTLRGNTPMHRINNTALKQKPQDHNNQSN